MEIVVLDGYSVNPGDLSWDGLKALGDVVIYDRTSADQLLQRAEDADCILTNKVVVSADSIKKLPRLRYIGVLATGYNVVDVDYATERGITVTNIPAYSTDSVVQMTFAHILNITNQVARYSLLNREGRWSRSKDFCYWEKPLPELSGMRIGIIGMGNIGRKVASVALAFGMKVFAATSKQPEELSSGIVKMPFDDIISSCDIITLHCPLTASTLKMINKSTIGKMRDGAIVINTGRGGLVDEQDVADALALGKLGAYGADVLSQEPPSAGNPLLSAPNAFITPHIAWATKEARQRLTDIATDNIRAFIEGRPQNTVNR